MKLLSALLLILLLASPLAAQRREVKVRLFAAQPPASVRIVNRGAASLNGAALQAPVDLKVVNGRLTIGGKPAPSAPVRITGAISIESAGNAPVSLKDPVEVGLSRGILKLVVTQPLEDYVVAVLAGEASSFKSMESLKAMAVAIRTYAVRFDGAHKADGFDFCDTTHCQDYRITAATDRLRSAVESTAGELLWYEGKPAATYYHQDCGGRTENAEAVWGVREPYLTAHEDAYCTSRGQTSWTTEITPDELLRAVGATTVEVANRTRGGRVQSVRLTSGAPKLLSGEAFRLAIGRNLGWNRLRSDDYELERVGGKFRFTGRGAGHGVGLCQAGAAQMGETGRSYREILTFYYPGTKLGVNAQGITWTRISGERTDLQSTRPESDRRILAAADRLVQRAEQEVGRRFGQRPMLRIFGSVAAFRDATGEPGWVAASTRGPTIRLQPLETLSSTTEKTLYHELLHVLVEEHAATNLPRWFREGVVLALSEPSALPATTTTLPAAAAIDRALAQPRTREELQQAYADAKRLVARLITNQGKSTVLAWIWRGLPPNLNIGNAANAPQH